MLNPYFENLIFTNNNEQDLLTELFVQSVQLAGVNVVYIPRDNVNPDSIFGTDVLSVFQRKYPMEMYLKSYDGFGGMGNIMFSAGMMIDKTAEFQVTDFRFKQELQRTPEEHVRPKEGDYIYLPMNRNLFEITFADPEERFWIYGKVYIWNLRTERVKYSSERINTNTTEIDNIMQKYTHELGKSIGIRLIRGGWRYTYPPTIEIEGNAEAVATITNGQVTGINIINPGSGYTKAPKINIVGDGHGAIAQAFLVDNSPDAINDSQKIQDEANFVLNFDEDDPFSLDGKV